MLQFMEIFTGFESNRLLHTFREMALRPGTTIRRYLRGTRQALYNPVDYALLMSGLSILLSLFSMNRSSEIASWKRSQLRIPRHLCPMYWEIPEP
jgi:hypothetical protein